MRPVRVGFVVRTFTYGGSEVETAEIINGADPNLLTFTGIAVTHPQHIPADMPPADGSFPPIYTRNHPSLAPGDPRVTLCADNSAAVRQVASSSDVIVTWGEPRLASYLPAGELPRIVISTKDSASWATEYVVSNALLTRWYVANSSVASLVYPPPLRAGVRVIYNGFNRARATARITRDQQRRRWGFASSDKVVGYLGRIEENKGVHRTVAGVALMPRDWKAVFIGKSPTGRYVGELEDQCRRLLPGRYLLDDWTQDVGSALNAFDVFCHPSDHEGFSNSLAEAWLAGVPTVYTSGTGAIPDLGDLGIPVSPGASATEIRDAILLAHGNEALASRARSVIESGFLARHMVERWTDYLREVAGAPRRFRVVLLVPAASSPLFAVWLEGLLASSDLDLCAVALEGDTNGVHAGLDSEFYGNYASPVFRIRGSDEVSEICRRTRPDGILAPPGPATRRLLSRVEAIPHEIVTGMDGLLTGFKCA